MQTTQYHREWYQRPGNADKKKAKDKARRDLYRTTKPLWHLIKAARDRANKKGLVFELGYDDFEMPTHCPILGLEIKINLGRFNFDSPSLDRVDNSKGYTKENTRVISRKANILKNDMSLQQIENMFKYSKGLL